MSRHLFQPGLATLVALAAFAGFAGAAGAARVGASPTEAATVTTSGPTAAPSPAAAGSAPAASPRALAAAGDSLAPAPLALRRAVAETARPHEVVRLLEAIDFAAGPAFDDADRAAFLLAQAYLSLGAADRFATLACRVSGWKRQTDYTRWIADLWRLEEAKAPFGAVACDSAGPGSADAFAAGGSDTSSAFGRDFAAAAAVRAASRALAAGQDARAILAAVPAASRDAATARHMSALLAWERGDTLEARRQLASLLADAPYYPARREVRLGLAALALDAGAWEAAHAHYAGARDDWNAARAEVERLRASDDVDSLWNAWRSGDPSAAMLVLDPAPVRASAAALEAASLDLRARPEVGRAPLLEPGETAPCPVPAPPADTLAAVALAGRRWDGARYERDRTVEAIADERESLARLRRYLDTGLGRARDEQALLRARTAGLDSLRGALGEVDARIQAVRDAWIARIVRRAAHAVAQAEEQRRWMRGMRFFHLEGPIAPPAGSPSADTLLTEEDRLAAAVRTAAEGMGATAPGLIARSYAEAWRPSLIDRVDAMFAGARAALSSATALETSLDSSLAAAATSATLRELEARADAQAREADALARVYEQLRARVAREAIDRALAGLDAEREGIDYGLAVSAYARAVGLETGDTAAVAAAAGEPSDASAEGRQPLPAVPAEHVATADGEALQDSPETLGWRAEAIAGARAFLEQHGDSPARGEMRFRLADLELVDARQSFRGRMAAYLADSTRADKGPLPVLETAPALALYRAILAEDPDFPHRDAVLFNAAMILADDGDPAALTLFEDLVTTHADSPYGQEAWLRMADMSFTNRDFAGAIERYRHSVAGPDPSLRAVALYKMGWAQVNEERPLDAVDAFRAVIDLYASAEAGTIRVDIAREAEDDLVQTLARAGGPQAFADYFDSIGRRPYELRLLVALGDYYRKYSMHGGATETEALLLARHPDAPEALASAGRLAATHRDANRPEDERRTLLDTAPRFAPGGTWWKAQSSDSMRAAGAAFAHDAWLTVARHHHREARAMDEDKGASQASSSDWAEARRLYGLLLTTWPDAPEAAELSLHAGEANARLGDYPAALARYRDAAKSDRDSVASEAVWQQVAVTDAWYEQSRGAAPAGSDSLAHAVIGAADTLLARFPARAEAADVRWRAAHLALAHGWLERSAADFGRMAADHPSDPRAPQAASLSADVLFRMKRFEDAGAAYARAVGAARAAGADSIALHAERALPVCAYLNAEAAVARDSSDHKTHAELFARVADGWPSYEHAPLARYRSGLAWLAAGKHGEAVQAMEALLREAPKSDYARDALLRIAAIHKSDGQREAAARAYASFIERYPDDAAAKDAWLEAADLFEAAGVQARADTLRLAYVKRYPDDVESAMSIYEALARRALDALDPERPVSSLIGAGKPPSGASHLAEYMKLAAAHPELASKELVARVRFLEGEEARALYENVKLKLPLPASLAAKQKRLDDVLARYGRAAEMGVPEWAHAAGYRIGEALVGFGQALEASERPADLSVEDRQGYDDVLGEQAQAFYDRGEGVWVELLKRQDREAKPDDWVAKARTSLWARLGDRFFFRPEAEFPVLAATPPDGKAEKKKHDDAKKERIPAKSDSAARSDSAAKAQAAGGAATAKKDAPTAEGSNE